MTKESSLSGFGFSAASLCKRLLASFCVFIVLTIGLDNSTGFSSSAEARPGRPAHYPARGGFGHPGHGGGGFGGPGHGVRGPAHYPAHGGFRHPGHGVRGPGHYPAHGHIGRRPVVAAPRRAVVVAPVRPIPAVRPWYWGNVVAGVTIGAIIAVAVVGSAPKAPSPELCWYWTSASKTRGYWSYCSAPPAM
ncbi:hypothetical protein [Methylocystis heyeri]|uniref:Uncharacterized protein n=1 Tax=Methylocystis heyeri TaxID=391905 RepID=A0A6B8KFC0_9HYPH|nr:hypothetical protein [Methylocystis heyeri]QGM45751.1 hypothetical protein H2LOC_008565 [Methylocystis heyeri]